ncbi:11183_t:CDS:2, partial [Racocetra fulgida]
MATDDGCKSLYVGNLDPRVTDSMLHEIFGVAGSVNNTKIIPDKNVSLMWSHPAMAGLAGHSTEQALQTLNGRKIYNMVIDPPEIKVNWAFQGQQGHKEDTSNHYHIFVGDLSPEVNDEVLAKAFSADARVMWDVNSGKSRGYGFVAFRDKTCSWGKDRAPEQATASYHTYGVPSTAYNYPYGYYSNHTAHPYATPVSESGYDLPPGMSAPPPSLASLDGAAAAAVVAGQQQHPTANWEQYSYNGYDAYGQYFPYGYNQPTGAGAPGAPGMGTPTSSHTVTGSHPPSVGSHGPSGG